MNVKRKMMRRKKINLIDLKFKKMKKRFKNKSYKQK